MSSSNTKAETVKELNEVKWEQSFGEIEPEVNDPTQLSNIPTNDLQDEDILDLTSGIKTAKV